MNTTARTNTAERLGRSLGQGWGAYARGERRASHWLTSKGMPVAGAALLLWVVKLAALGVLLYVAFWLALLVVVTLAAGWSARNTDWEEPQPEWRTGPLGFGLYHPDGSRIDPHDPDAEA